MLSCFEALRPLTVTNTDLFKTDTASQTCTLKRTVIWSVREMDIGPRTDRVLRQTFTHTLTKVTHAPKAIDKSV